MSTHLAPLPDTMLEPLIRAALAEDLGDAGDITTTATIPPNQMWSGELVARQPGIVAGIDMARLAFHALDPAMKFQVFINDGEKVKPRDLIAVIHGNARAILSAERVALNYLCHMSGIATATHNLVEAVKPHKARIACTRKTTPGLRSVEKYAVRAGGGINHRFGLYDAVLIKDNHIAASGSITAAVERAKSAAGHLVKIEVEVDTLAQLQEVLTLPVDTILLDNMDTATLQQAVKLVAEKTGGRITTEASGGVTLQTVAAIAATGVDVISTGWITHSAPILDIGLDAAR